MIAANGKIRRTFRPGVRVFKFVLLVSRLLFPAFVRLFPKFINNNNKTFTSSGTVVKSCFDRSRDEFSAFVLFSTVCRSSGDGDGSVGRLKPRSLDVGRSVGRSWFRRFGRSSGLSPPDAGGVLPNGQVLERRLSFGLAAVARDRGAEPVTRLVVVPVQRQHGKSSGRRR